MVSDGGPRLDPDYRRARTADQKRERETAILLAARREFEEMGFHGFRMRAVAQRLHISKAALYNYHRSKATILADLTRGMLESWASDVERSLATPLSTENAARALTQSLRGRDTALRLLDILTPLIIPDLTEEERNNLLRALESVDSRVGLTIRRCVGAQPASDDPLDFTTLSTHVLAIARTNIGIDQGVAKLLAGSLTQLSAKPGP